MTSYYDSGHSGLMSTRKGGLLHLRDQNSSMNYKSSVMGDTHRAKFAV